MTLRRLVATLALTAGLLASPAGAGEDDPAAALALPMGDPALRELAAAWRGREAALLAALADPDADRRRGAARLLAHAELPAAEALAALAASDDRQVRRLGAGALRARLAGVEPARLLALRDADIACLLLAAHPGDPLADRAVAAQVEAWLGDPAACTDAADLLTQRGTLAAWGAALVAQLGSPHAAVVRCAHQALCLLAGEQRPFAAYAGHHQLLAQDWKDRLARGAASAAEPDPALAPAVASLPAETALLELLGRGPAALAAVEQAMAGADRARRRELAVAARLLARAVTPALYRALGEGGLAGMDAEEPRARHDALRRAAEAVAAGKDAAGLAHLLSYADDRDSGVRAAAFDRLVRLSDQRRDFGGEWELGQDKLFAPDLVVPRLRQAFQRGSADEQIAAMQLAASLRAGAVAGDVLALLLSPAPAVADSAIEALGHLGVDDAQLPTLIRLAADATQPAARRAQLLGIVAKRRERHVYVGGRQQQKAPVEQLAALRRIAEEADDPVVSRAAAQALMALPTGKEMTADVLRGFAGGAPGRRLIAAELAREVELPAVWAFTVPLLADGDPAVAAAAVESVLHRIDEEDERAAIAPLLGADGAARLAAAEDPRRKAIAYWLGALDEAQALAAARPAGAAAGPLIAALAARARSLDTLVAAVGIALRIEDAHGIPWDLSRALQRRVLFAEGVLEEIVASGDLDLLPSEGSSSGGGSRGMYRELRLPDGQKLRLEGTARPDAKAEDRHDERSFVWRIAKPPSGRDSRERVLAAFAQLEPHIAAMGEDGAELRLLRALVVGEVPPRELIASTWQRHDELWGFLLRRHPALRPDLITAIDTATEIDWWRIRRFAERGSADLARAAMRALARDQGWIDSQLTAYLLSLDPATLRPHLREIAGRPELLGNADLRALWERIGPLPLALALAAAKAELLGEHAIQPYGDDAQAALKTALAAWTPDEIRTRAVALRALREAGQPVFDRVLAELAAGADAVAVAWLRSGLPLRAGLVDLYRRALTAEDPALRLVGIAWALKAGELDAAGFAAALARMPPPVLGDAALVARRYLAKRLDGQGPALAAALARSPLRAVPAWIAALPADEAVADALAARLAEPGAIGICTAALRERLATDAATWAPQVRRMSTRLGGRLDQLLPAASAP